MSDSSTWSLDDMAKCQQSHRDLDDSATALLRSLSLEKKQKLLELMQKWTAKLTA